MNRTVFALAIVATSLAGAGEQDVGGRAFRLPDGFTIERVAGPPLVDRPIVADFDERGRLYVADSSGSNENVQKQLAERPHRIVRLEDADGDGVFDTRTVFADKMMFPEGAMWKAGSLYVSAPPSIWKLTDTDDDGVADERVEWFKGKTLTGCANDLHGPYAGPDGRIYWCKGAFARQSYDRPGKPPLSTRASHIFRARPDGTGIEPVMTGGMDNPVDVVFTTTGERIFTTTFLQHPGGGRRDGLIHDVYGALFGKVHDVLDDHPHTGPDVLPPLTHLGPAAPAGLARYESDAFGAEFADNLFACQFNLRKVSRHRLVPDGSTFVTRDHEFLSSPDGDFHPTDVVEDADGSLLVVDTGGWYKLCCPTSQLEKPDILGAIYRIRRPDAPRVSDPRGLKLDWSKATPADLAARLDDARPAVRRRTVETLAAMGRDALPALDRIVRGPAGSRTPLLALWTATRIDDPEARAIVRAGLDSTDSAACQTALNSVSLWKDEAAVPQLIEALRTRSRAMVLSKEYRPQEPLLSFRLGNRRVAAEALGRIGAKSAVPAILDALADPINDRFLDHALTYALIEIADPEATALGLARPDPRVKRACLMALDQMAGGGLSPEAVASHLSATDPALRESAAWVLARHPDWGGALAGMLGDRLRSKGLAETDRVGLTNQVARFAKAKAVQDLLSAVLRDPASSPESRRVALGAMAAAGLKEVPAAWVEALAGRLKADDPDSLARAVATVRALPFKGESPLTPLLLALSARPALPISTRLEALAAVPGGLARVDPGTFDLLMKEVQPDRPVATRLLAAEVISRATLSADELRWLTGTIATAGPLEIDRLLAPFASSSDEHAGLLLIMTLDQSKVLANLRIESIKPRLAKMPPEVHRRAEGLYLRINAGLAEQKTRVDELVANLGEGDVRRGQLVFNGSKAACRSCHAVGYVGGTVGPDLTRIGGVRVGRDLIEAIVYPSASFVRSYEPVVVATKDGRSFSGLVRRDAPDGMVLATGPDAEARIPRDEIDEVRPGSVSVMPAGLDQGLSRQELADLIAFLKSRK